MSLTVNNNLSALRAFSKQMSVSADNVANALTDEFKAGKTVNTSGQNHQVKTVITRPDTPGPLVEDPLKTDGSLKELSNTDIAEELVQQISIKHGFEANAKTIQTYEETIGSLIDIVG